MYSSDEADSMYDEVILYLIIFVIDKIMDGPYITGKINIWTMKHLTCAAYKSNCDHRKDRIHLCSCEGAKTVYD